MLVAMSAFLVSVAELSNIISVFATILCFFAMAFLITKNMMALRLHEEFLYPVHAQQPQKPRVQMMKITIPFILKLEDSSCTSEDDCIDCVITSQNSYTLRVFWGVSIKELHMFLWKPWSAMQSCAQLDNMLEGCYQVKGVQSESASHGERKVSIKMPDLGLDLGPPPRLFYPLVIFLMRNEAPSASLQPNDTVALVNVIHIKDSVCTLPTSVLAQYLKQANGQLSCLKQLYLAAGNDSTSEESALECAVDKEGLSLWAIAGEQLCVVCQYYPVSRALLPCRHTCVCSVCFDKLDRCPMCRSPFAAYFTVRSEEYTPLSDKKPENGTEKVKGGDQRGSWLIAWNERVHHFLGHH